MSGEELKRLVPRWAAEVGVEQARLQLQIARVGFSTAEKMIKGEYESTPTGTTCDKLKLAMRDFIAGLEAS